jgi:8-oxo-dGTP pyrophosphatase MutT (NUDIX family)
MDAQRIAGLRASVVAMGSRTPREPCPVLTIGGIACGRLQPAAARHFRADARGIRALGEGFGLVDPATNYAERTARLQEGARALLDAGLSGPWRGESLAVRSGRDEAALGEVDRSAVRALGITTHSVHVNAFAPDGRLVVSRRAPGKRVDPGLWDTLAGGIVAAGESARVALVRESWEEAGLDLEGIPVREVGRVFVQRPIPEGHLFEWVDIFDLVVPDPGVLANRDGEVDAIESRPVEAILGEIERGLFTVEASLAILESIATRA